MTPSPDPAPAPTTNLLGKRYRCTTCGVEILCLAHGNGQFVCHDHPMQVIQLAALPSSD